MSAFLNRADVRRIDYSVIEQELQETLVIDARHVFFFDRGLDSEAKRAFDARVAGFYRTLSCPLLQGRARSEINVAYAFDDTCAEFNALTPDR